jgi:hypothetical protein
MASPSQLDRNLIYSDSKIERSDSAAIVAEIAERVIELSERFGEAKAQKWVLKLADMFRGQCPEAGWLYLRVCTGDMSQIKASHSQSAIKKHCSKQYDHKQHAEALRVIKLNFPALAEAIKELENK